MSLFQDIDYAEMAYEWRLSGVPHRLCGIYDNGRYASLTYVFEAEVDGRKQVVRRNAGEIGSTVVCEIALAIAALPARKRGGFPRT